MGFDIQKYIANSKALDTSDIDWEEAKKYPLTPDERRAVYFFACIESYTVVYLRDFLNTRLMQDAEVAAFLPCWAYEEGYHGRALMKLLEVTAGPDDPPVKPLELGRRNLKEHFDAVGSRILGALTRHFVAVHMTWGSMNELTADTAYRLLGERTKNPALRELTTRIMRDERRHFAFYFDQARKRLESRFAQRVVRWMMTTVWQPVGNGIAEAAEVDTVAEMMFSDGTGLEAAREIDRRMAELPCMQGLNLLEDAARRAAQRSQERRVQRAIENGEPIPRGPRANVVKLPMLAS